MAYLIIVIVTFVISWKLSKAHSLIKETRNVKYISEIVKKILSDDYIEIINPKKIESMEEL